MNSDNTSRQRDTAVALQRSSQAAAMRLICNPSTTAACNLPCGCTGPARIFRGAAEQVAAVRRFVRSAASDHPALDDAVLVASELAANATAHSASGTEGGMFMVRVAEVKPGHIAILVTDQGAPTHPQARAARPTAESGRGLQVVQSLTSLCLTLDHGELRTVFAVIPASPTETLEPASPRPASRDRHDMTRASDPSAVIPDAPSAELCPDPLTASTADEFLDVLQQYWIWAGRPSYRAMARQIGQRFSASTLHTALNAATLPSFDKIQAIIEGCRGTTLHQQAFATAWRKLHMHH